jgi:outer membrane protein assembly factor BamB
MDRHNTDDGAPSVPNQPEEAKNTDKKPLPLRRRFRWWIAAIIVAAAAGNIARLRLTPELDNMTRGLNTFLTIMVSVGALAVWWIFLTRFRWRTRLAVFAVVAIVAIGARQLIRIDGSANGRGSAKIVWRWTPKRTGNVAEIKAAPSTQSLPKLEGAVDYPGYLGANRSGVVPDAQLESDWTAHAPQQVWRRPIGLGWSGFAVSGGHAVTQEQRGENELVVCYDLATGNPLWSHTNVVRFSEPMGGDGPRATPTIDRDRVYAVGATGILDCVDAATGKLIWTRDALKEESLPNTYFGKSSSPLVVDDLVVVTGGMAKKSTLLAFRRDDGSPAWRAGNDEASFTSPELVILAGRRQILSVNASTVTGQDPKDGRVLWEYAWGNNKWPKCAQPIALDGDRILLSASFNAGCVLLQIKANPQSEFSAAEIWKNRNMKSEFSNLVTRDGFLYGLDDGILACVDLATGERKWKDGHYGHGQVMLANDLLLVQTEQGPIALVEANPSGYREVAHLNALSAKTWNTPALAGEFLLVRNDQEAVCYRLPRRVTRSAGL